MASIVSICNLALSNLGAENIVALTEKSTEARACNQFYDHVRDLLLQSYPWRFAGKTIALAEVTNDKLGAWGYAYKRPNDCLKVRSIRPVYSTIDPTPDDPGYPFDIEGDTIYCDLPTAFLRFTRQITDPTAFSPLFVDAFSWHLSVRLAMPVTKDTGKRKEAYQLAVQMQSAAEVADANEVRETSDSESSFVAGR